MTDLVTASEAWSVLQKMEKIYGLEGSFSCYSPFPFSLSMHRERSPLLTSVPTTEPTEQQRRGN
jgi:hypothetical protein